MAWFLLAAAAVHPPHTLQAIPSPETAPDNVISLPLILLVGCDPDLEARCRAIGARAKVLVRSMRSMSPRTHEIRALSPLVIIVSADVYESQPWGFEVMAEHVGASLLMLDHAPLAPIVLEYRMMEALVFVTRLRARVREAAAESAAR